MIDTAMPGPLFTGLLAIHIASGTVGALIIFPVLIFGSKSPFHRRFGRYAKIDTWIILISGGSLLLDPLFLVYWMQAAKSITTIRHDYVHVFANAMDAWLFFVYLDVLLAYLVFTGIGVWKRLRNGNPKTGFPPRRADVILTSVAAALTVFMLLVGVSSFGSNRGYATILMGSALPMLMFYAVDLRTWFRGGHHVKHWWAIHAWKLSVAWAALIYAVFLRWRAKSTVLDALTSEVMLAIFVSFVVMIGLYSARLHRKGKLARLLSRVEHPLGGNRQ